MKKLVFMFVAIAAKFAAAVDTLKARTAAAAEAVVEEAAPATEE